MGFVEPIVLFCYWCYSCLCVYMLLVVLLMYISVLLQLLGSGCVLDFLCQCVYICSSLVPLCILLCFCCWLQLLSSQGEHCEIQVWGELIYPSSILAYIFVKNFQFLYQFSWFYLCLFLLVFNPYLLCCQFVYKQIMHV